MPGVVLGTEDTASVPLERAVCFQEESVLEAAPVCGTHTGGAAWCLPRNCGVPAVPPAAHRALGMRREAALGADRTHPNGENSHFRRYVKA